MKRLTVLIPLALGIHMLDVDAQQEATRLSYSLRMDQAVPGSRDFTEISSGAPYPLNKRYEQFTTDEKGILRSYYEGMPDTDEPPFPARGMKDIIADISTLVGKLRAEGNVTIFVSVNEKGEATSVRLLSYPNMEVAKAVAYVLVKARYKPAVCGGQPCALEFPFRFRVGTR